MGVQVHAARGRRSSSFYSSCKHLQFSMLDGKLEGDVLFEVMCQELEEQTARNEKRERLKSIRQSCAITPSDAAGLAVELGAAPPDLVRTLSDPAMPSPAKKKPL